MTPYFNGYCIFKRFLQIFLKVGLPYKNRLLASNDLKKTFLPNYLLPWQNTRKYNETTKNDFLKFAGFKNFICLN